MSKKSNANSSRRSFSKALERGKTILRMLNENAVLLQILFNLVFIVGIGISQFNMNYKLDLIQTNLAQQQEPITYSLTSGKSTKYNYYIMNENIPLKRPAITTYLTIKTGIVKRITTIVYDEGVIQSMTECPMTQIHNELVVGIDVEPIENAITYGDKAYDYFFLYVEAMSGEKSLDLIVTEIDLNDTEEDEICTQKIYHQIDLLRIGEDESFESPAYKYIFENYMELNNKLQALNEQIQL